MTDAPGFRFHHAVDVRFRDLDALGHAHHSLALIYFEEARAAYWREVAGRPDVQDVDYIIAEITVNYVARTLYPGALDVAVRTSRLGGKSFDMEYEVRSPAGELLVKGRTVQVMFDYAAGQSKAMPADIRQKIDAYEQLQ